MEPNNIVFKKVKKKNDISYSSPFNAELLTIAQAKDRNKCIAPLTLTLFTVY